MNIDKIARKATAHFESHGVPLKLYNCEIIGGGDLLIFTVKLKRGTRESLFFDRASDIQTALRLPLFQPFKENLSLRLAVSDKPARMVNLRDMLKNSAMRRTGIRIPIALGCDMRRKLHCVDLAMFPHALYGGATGSGKTVALRCTIASIAAIQPVNRVNLIISDTGASGLDLFNGLPHLACPVIKDEVTAVLVLQALVAELERRISLPVDELRRLPAIVYVGDEYISLVSNIDDIELRKALIDALSNLLRRGRHAKIHMIMATQEAAKKDMLINLNNLNARIAFRCSNYYNSMSILGTSGAEKLPGKGAMLYKPPEQSEPVYLQGAYMPTEELRQLVAYVASKPHDFNNKFVISELEQSQQPQRSLFESTSALSMPDSRKELADIILWTLSRDSISVLQIQKQFRMGNRANEVVDEMFRMNLISDKFANQPRVVLPNKIEELTADIQELLRRYGYTDDNINEAFNHRHGVEFVPHGAVSEVEI